MLQIGALAFVQPWLLAALATLPALWWLLRVTPPAPRRQSFPAIRLLQGLNAKEESAARTPWWLVLLRLLALGLIILGLAQPVLNPLGGLSGSGPLVIVVDNGWAAADRWPQRMQVLDRLGDQAAREGREVVVLPTAQAVPGDAVGSPDVLTAAQARQRIDELRPLPWPSDHAAAAEVLAGWDPQGAAHAVWLSDGLAGGADADVREGQRRLAAGLQRLGRLEVYMNPPQSLPLLLRTPERAADHLSVPVERAAAGAERAIRLLARDRQHRILGEAGARFAPGDVRAEATFELPVELRNRIASITLEGQNDAGARLLLDESWQRRSVGLVATGAGDSTQPLLDELYYLERALAPYAEVARGDPEDLAARGADMLILPDSAMLTDAELAEIVGWTRRGGVLLRFAGPRLAEALESSTGAADGLTLMDSDDRAGEPLLPVPLRRGERSLGGALTWDVPAGLQAFPDSSPLAGLTAPEDVRVRRQVLAEPSPDLAERTWARLADGTPLVTAAPLDDGWRILVHTTASPAWSDLALSGLFVEMLRRFAEFGDGPEAATDGEDGPRLLSPVETLDGHGVLGPPPGTARPLAAAQLAQTTVGPAHPPGYYGLEDTRRAFNLQNNLPSLRPLDGLPTGIQPRAYGGEQERSLGPWLLAMATLLLLLDLLIALGLRGLLPGFGDGRGHARAAVLALAAVCGTLLLPAGHALAQDGTQRVDEDFAIAASLETRLAYLETGDPLRDETTERGLVGLTRMLARRTSVEPASPMAVDPAQHDLRFFPFVYWSISPQQADLSPAAAENVNAYLESGGTLLIDLAEPGYASGFGSGADSQGQEALRRLARDLALPELAPIDPEHVLTRAFYLLQDFPGRYDGGTLWIERPLDQGGEGVARLIVGTNDWAGAWAVDEEGRYLNAVTPGGERQREFAYRFGVNLVIYALTGNYKDDQVHVPSILERLGQ